MTDRAQNGMTCSQFEALLAEALDAMEDAMELHRGAGSAGETEDLAVLPAQVRAAFADHRQSCRNCGPLYAEAREGMLLLRGLEDVEPPRNLVHNILAVTSGAETRVAAKPGEPAQPGWLERMRGRLVPSFAGVLRSRFAASFCMAFFSLSLTLSLIGVRVTDIAHLAAHPTELRKTVVLEYNRLQARVVSYYDNMRLVYEVQNRVRELKKAAGTSATDDKGTTQPDQQNLIQPAPGVPEFKEVVQPQGEEARKIDQKQWSGGARRRLTAEDRVPDLRELPTREIAEFMRKTEGAQI